MTVLSKQDAPRSGFTLPVLCLVFSPSVFHCRWPFISHLAWKGNKRTTHPRSHVILLSHNLPIVFYFCLRRSTLSGSRVWDKPSVVLCGEIIWLADKKNACRASRSLLLLSSHHFLPGGVWKLPAAQRFIQNYPSGYTFGKMSTLPLRRRRGRVRLENGTNSDVQLISVFKPWSAISIQRTVTN